ncbi:MAG: Rieske 2Fe-2S domain-containing protein, partial [Actinomycetota bacterium]
MSAAATTARPRRVTARAIEGQELVLLGVLAVLWLVLSFAVDTFFTASTLQDLMAAVAPLCPHRLVPLSAASVTGGRLRCAYHGWEFDETGTCVLLPSLGEQSNIPPRAHLA